MADIGHELTEDLLTGLEKRIKEEYEIAVADAERKYAAWLKKFTRQKEEQRALYEAGQITKTEYQNWCYRHMMMGREWEKMRDTLAHDLHNASVTASKMARETAPDALALNMNYGTYMIENGGKIDTGFSLYNHDTAEVLLRDENIQLMPGPSTKKAAEIAANKDLQWNMRHIDSAVIQGVLQGESPYDIARRLSQVGQMDYNASVRYARTMITSAQNAGRYQAFRRADKLGVQLTIEWQATLDGRTRHDHRMMHGQRRNVDEPFETPDGFKIMWPADCSSGSSDAPQSEIWNCRCTLLSWVKGFEGDTVTSSPKMGSMSFEEWQHEKEPTTIQMPNIAVGRSLSAKRKSYDILDLATGERYDLADGTYIRNVQVFAGKGTRSEFRDAAKYAKRYGGSADQWQHAKGIGIVRTGEGDREAELHWVQCDGVGKFEFFIKEWND